MVDAPKKSAGAQKTVLNAAVLETGHKEGEEGRGGEEYDYGRGRDFRLPEEERELHCGWIELRSVIDYLDAGVAVVEAGSSERLPAVNTELS